MTERIYDGALDLIGHTPLVRLSRITGDRGAEVCGKLESSNVGGSVKDRPALSMILAAEQSGELGAGSTVVEATSGNTGISLAMICAVRGYRCVIVMPEDMSETRRHLLKSFGAEIVLTGAEDGMAGAVERAERILETTSGAMMCRQFENPANPEIHAKTTAEEIWEATGGKVDAFVAGVGTGGTLTVSSESETPTSGWWRSSREQARCFRAANRGFMAFRDSGRASSRPCWTPISSMR